MTPTHSRPDAIDRAADLDSSRSLFALRDVRSAFVAGAARCRQSVIEPQNDLGLSKALRTAVARRLIRKCGTSDLLGTYPEPDDEALTAVANGAIPVDERLAAIAHHADMIAARPGEASAESLATLSGAGLTTAQIIALSELIGFLAFEVRVVAGLRLLRDAA